MFWLLDIKKEPGSRLTTKKRIAFMEIPVHGNEPNGTTWQYFKIN